MDTSAMLSGRREVRMGTVKTRDKDSHSPVAVPLACLQRGRHSAAGVDLLLCR